MVTVLYVLAPLLVNLARDCAPTTKLPPKPNAVAAPVVGLSSGLAM